MYRAIHLYFFILIFGLTACNTEKVIPNSLGKPGEINLVVGKNINSATVQFVKSHLETEVEFLAKAEKQFNIFTVPASSFKSIYKKHRNIILLNNSNENKLSKTTNKWAKNQLIYSINTNNDTTFLKQASQNIITAFNTIELKKVQQKLKFNSQSKLIAEQHQIEIKLPKHYTVTQNTKHNFWIRKESTETSFGIFGYYETSDLAINKRDSILKYNIPGPTPGSYMKTTPYTHLKNDSVCYGIWDLQNDFMGGPFIERTISIKNNTLKLYAYLYAPNKQKRELFRELEVIIKGVKVN